MTHKDGNDFIVGKTSIPTPRPFYFKSPIEGETVKVKTFSGNGPRYYFAHLGSPLSVKTLLPIEAPPRLEHVDIVARFLYLSDSFETKTPDLRSKQVEIRKPNIEILHRHDLLPEKNLSFYSTGFQNGEKTIMRKFFRAIGALLRADCKHGTIDNTLLVRFLASKEKKN